MHITVWKYAEKQDKEVNYMRRKFRKILALTTAIAVVAGVLPLDGGALSSKITNGGLTVSAAEFTSPETGNGVTPEEDPEVTFSDNDASVESAEALFTDNDTADNEGALQDREEEITVQSVQNLIDALPSSEEVSEMSFEEQEKVYEKLQNAYETYETLTEEEKSQLTGMDAFDELFDYFNGMVSAAGAGESNGLTVTQSNGDTDFYVYSDNTLTIKDTGTGWIKISGSGTKTEDRIVVEGGNTVNIILNNVNIQQSSDWTSAFLIENNAIVNLTLEGENVLQSGMTCAGLQVEGTLNIIGGENGSLRATGGDNGAGIGGGQNKAVGNIRINGGTVTAIGGDDGAGIGGGNNGTGGDIRIGGGTVTAKGDAYGAGIGGGASGAGGIINIEGGTVTAKGGVYGAGIGGGGSGAGGTINITGGTVIAISLGSSGYIGGAGIGGGSSGDGGDISITGGEVTATGGNCGAGIGGGDHGDGGSISITGGKVIATGGNSGAGIGGGNIRDGGEISITGGTVTATGGAYGAGIGGGSSGAGGEISITGGTVTANAGCHISNQGGGGAGIGAGNGYNPQQGTKADSIVINGGIVTANSFSSDVADIGNSSTVFSTTISDAEDNEVLGSAIITCESGGIKYSPVSGALQCIINHKGNSTVYGNMTLNTDLTIQKNYKMTIPSGNSLIISSGVTLTNNGIIESDISGNGTIDLRGGGSITGSGSKSGVMLICSVNRTVSKNIDFEGNLYANDQQGYSATLSAKEGYDLPEEISVRIDGNPKPIPAANSTVKGYTYDKTNNPAKLIIPKELITGNIEIEVKAMYEIELTPADSETGLTVLDFGEETYGYDSSAAQEITVTNIGEKGVEVGLPSSDDYDFAWTSGNNGNTRLQPGNSEGNSASFSVQPELGLNAGIYENTITVSTVSESNSVSENFTAKFRVKPITTWNSSTPGQATVTWGSVKNANEYSVQLYKDEQKSGGAVNENELMHTFGITEKGSYKAEVTAKVNLEEIKVETSSLQFYSVDFNTDNGQNLPSQVVVKGGNVSNPLPSGTVLSKAGYIFGGWYSDPAFTSVSRWDFGKSAVQGDTTLYARWLVPSYSYYTITASAGTGGTITPSGNCSIREWLDKTFTITPDSGYEIADVLVDGKSVGAQSSYTFKDVISNHTISASFLKIVPQEYPDGTKAKPDGSFETPNGTVILPDGTIVLPDGIRIELDEDGNRPVIDKDNVVTAPDGTVYKPDGTVHNTDGSVQDHAGTYLSPAKAWVDFVNAAGNKITILLTGEAAGAAGYDYVIGTSADMLKTREYYKISKNKLGTETLMQYVEKGTYYAACHAWIRGTDGKKVFGLWSELKEFRVDAVTPETPKIKNVKVSKQTVTVTYTVCSDAEGYDIVLGKEYKKVNEEKRPVNYGTLVKKVKNGNTVTVTFRNVTPGTYYAGLHSWNRTSEDGKKVFSPWSGVKKVVVK